MILYYIAGMGGSGKTTLAKKMLGENPELINIGLLKATFGNGYLAIGHYVSKKKFCGGDKELNKNAVFKVLYFLQLCRGKNFSKIIIENHMLSKSINKTIIMEAINYGYRVNIVFKNTDSFNNRLQRGGKATNQSKYKSRLLKQIAYFKSENNVEILEYR